MAKPTKHYDTWRIRWTDETGKRRSATFTEKKTAELALRKAELEAEERRRGLRPPELQPRTFLDASEYWRTHRAPQKRSQGDDLSMLRQLEPHFGKLLLSDRAGWVIAVDQYRTHKARLNRKTVANHLTLLGSILRVAHELGWMEQLPVIRKPRVRLHSTDYSYLRTGEEEARFLRAAVPEGRMVYVLYLTAISTGLRAGELAGLQWADVDFGTRLITVQRSFEQPTKSDDVRYVPILDSLLPELRRWRLEQPGRLVFTNQNGTMLGKCARAYQEVLRRVLDRANFPRIQRGGKERRYIHFHDLRHTFASRWVMKGGDLFKLQKILGHKSMAMTLRYAHLQPSAFAEDYGRFGVGDPAHSGSVVELPVSRRARNQT